MNDPRFHAARPQTDAPFPAASDRGDAGSAEEDVCEVPAPPAISPRELDERRRELELELTRIRSEASAARLQARAAELELMIRRLSQGRVSDETAGSATAAELLTPPFAWPPVAGETLNGFSGAAKAQHFHDWDQARAAVSAAMSNTGGAGAPPTAAPVEPPPESERPQSASTTSEPGDRQPQRTDPLQRSDPPRRADRQGKAGRRKTEAAGRAVGLDGPAKPQRSKEPAKQTISEGPAKRQRSETSRDKPPGTAFAAGQRNDKTCSSGRQALIAKDRPTRSPAAENGRERGRASAVTPVATIRAHPPGDPSADDPPPKRKRSAAWFASAAVHAAIFMVLAAMTLSAQPPKDQVALSAAVSEPQQTPMETFSIETLQPETEPTEPTTAEVVHELSPLGQLAAAELDLEAPPVPAEPTATRMLRQATAFSAASVNPATKPTTQFCGVSGGGNHFVYLVDSSGSMGDAFASARAELLRSIDLLGPDQRFYVVFFDAEPDYMRLAHPNRDEPTSVLATPENKRRLRQWAMQIAINRGRAPYDPLRFALELRPDVIFLLSDGEYPQGIEELLRTENRLENLFGDSGPISIVHTIGYHSREGERRMRRIAAQNGGQYRHVPKR